MKLPRKKIWNNIAWMLLGAGAIVLLVSAVSRTNHKKCEGLHVEINGEANNFFVDEKEVIGLIQASQNLIGLQQKDIDLRLLEARLKSEKWIANADLFFDNNHMLQVKVQENEPVARLFTVSGNSFYIDSTGKRLPLSDKRSARVPMFTGFPSERKKLSRPDSIVMARVMELSMIIRNTPFWKAQVAQVDISPDGFEMVPTIGNHIVVLGTGENMKEKLDRLYSFYKQVWAQVGLEKYEKLDVQYDRLVVATKRGGGYKGYDSVRAKQALNELMEKAREEKNQAIELAVKSPDIVKSKPKKIVEKDNGSEDKKVDDKAAQKSKPTKVEKPIEEKKETEKPEEKRIPKAVMEKRGN
jgi:cell division protein FtsQ